MKAFSCRVLCLAVFSALLAVPAVAADANAGLFHLDNAVAVGSVKVPAGLYVFRVSDSGLVRVYDQDQTTVVASALTQRHALKRDELAMSGTLSHDWAVRTVTIGSWQYSFSPTPKPADLAGGGASATTVVAQLR